MTIDSAVFAFVSFMIILSLALTVFFSHYLILLTLFIGVMMVQSAFTGFCPPAFLFRKFGFKSGRAFFK